MQPITRSLLGVTGNEAGSNSLCSSNMVGGIGGVWCWSQRYLWSTKAGECCPLTQDDVRRGTLFLEECRVVEIAADDSDVGVLSFYLVCLFGGADQCCVGEVGVLGNQGCEGIAADVPRGTGTVVWSVKTPQIAELNLT